MRNGLRVLCCVCVAIMLCCTCMTAMAEESVPASQALIERMVISFAAYGDRDTQAMEELAALTRQLAANQGVTESLKACDQMEWVRRMNSIRNRAEEMVLHEVVYGE